MVASVHRVRRQELADPWASDGGDADAAVLSPSSGSECRLGCPIFCLLYDYLGEHIIRSSYRFEVLI